MLDVTSSRPMYFVVNILTVKGTKDISLSVALNKTNLYVLAYADPDAGRSYFFKDTVVAKASLFPGIPVKETLTLESGYGSLESNSNLKRQTMIMSFESLKFSMLAVHGKKKIPIRDQARFFLYMAQSISEAARFTYIQKKFAEGTSAVPDFKARELENQWGTISKLIKTAKNRKFKRPLMLKNPDGSPWMVDSVDQIRNDMGILSYVPNANLPFQLTD